MTIDEIKKLAAQLGSIFGFNLLFDANNNPVLQKCNANGEALVEIAGGTVNAIFEPDKETPTMLFRVRAGQSFTGASAGDPILAVLTINTVTNTLVSANPLWYNGNTKLQLNNADVDTAKLEVIASNSLTLSEFQTVFGNTSDSAATTDTGTFSFIALFKRNLEKLTSLLSNFNALTSDTPTSVPSSATTTTLIAANANRRSLTIFNNSTAILYVTFGATATQAGAKFAIQPAGFYEMPTHKMYTGVISGIWASATGNASIYEGV